MLRSLEFRNYKAFPSGRIEFKPLTILIGANNVGKTSILELLLLLHQTAVESGSAYRSALKLNGRFVSIGAPELLFPGGNRRLQPTITVAFSSPALHVLLTSGLVSSYAELLSMSIASLFRETRERPPAGYSQAKIVGIYNRVASYVRAPAQWGAVSDADLRDIEHLLRGLVDTKTRMPKAQVTERPPEYAYMGAYGLFLDGRRGPLPSELAAVGRFLARVCAIRSRDFQVSFKLGHARSGGLLYFRELTLQSQGLVIFRVRFSEEGRAVRAVETDMAPESDWPLLARSLGEHIGPATLFQLFDHQEGGRSRFAENIVRQVMGGALGQVAEALGPRKVLHVSPIRANPRRFYLLDIAGAGASEGETLVDTLREDPVLRSRVNSYLETFGITVDVDEIAELVYRLAVRQEGLDLDLDITDVGFGISQVLPVFAQALMSQEDSICLIEQPEIHLHPRMQAELADFFVDICSPSKQNTGGGRSFVIETHSEYFLNRLRRRIADKTLPHNDIAIYYVHPTGEPGKPKLERLKVPTNGDFVWPRDFYVTDLEDTIEFLSRAA
jgi:hypothetical protein